jgi:H+/Cl- antiporter ClcA
MEMTGSQPMLFWLLIGALMSSVFARQFCPHPFYHLAAGRFRRQAMVETGRHATPHVPLPVRNQRNKVD